MSLSHAIGKRQPCVRNEVKHLYLKVATFGGLIVVVFPGFFNLFFFLFLFFCEREKNAFCGYADNLQPANLWKKVMKMKYLRSKKQLLLVPTPFLLPS